MPSLSEIPFLDRYRQREAQIRGEGLDELKQVSGVMTLQGLLQKQQEARALKQVMAQSGGDPAKAIPLLVQAGHYEAASKLGDLMKNIRPAEFNLGPGQSRFRDGSPEPIASMPAAPRTDNRPEILRLIDTHDSLPEGHPNRERILGRITYLNEGRPPAEKEAWGEPYELGGAWVQRSDKGNVRQVVGRAPQTRVDVPAPVTAVTIQDPNDPNGTIIIDGRTRQVLGKGPKLTDRGKMDEKRAFQMEGLGLALQKAEDLLMGQRRDSEGNITPGSRPTGSGIGSVVDTVGGWAGVSMPGAAEAADLRVVAGQLISKVPRFEGPQSDKDTALYRQMAAEAGNEKTPIATRLSAVRKMREVYGRYERGESGRLAGETTAQTRQPGTQLGAPRPRNVLDEADAILRGGR